MTDSELLTVSDTAEICPHCGKECGGLCQRQMNELTRLLLLAESRMAANAVLNALPTVSIGFKGNDACGESGGSDGAKKKR